MLKNNIDAKLVLLKYRSLNDKVIVFSFLSKVKKIN